MSSPTIVGPLGPDVARHYPTPYAVVDVETTGLSPSRDRIVQISVRQMSSSGALEDGWTSLVDPGRDPGPSHIHGIHQDDLADAPQFKEIAASVVSMLDRRIIVAHNARFDWSFLDAECRRAGTTLPSDSRLCTVSLTRRLELPLSNMRLASVAAYWGIPQVRAHDAEDDVRVTVEVARHSLAMSHRLGLELPLASCRQKPRHPVTYPPSAPRTACPWRYPGRLEDGRPLTQGMTVAISADTTRPREDLIACAADAGLKVMNSVSGRTSLVVANDPSSPHRKITRAHAEHTAILSEAAFVDMLPTIAPGRPKSAPDRTVSRTRHPSKTGNPQQLTGRRVLVLAGTHADAASLRSRITDLGGQSAVNLTTSVTDYVVLPGHTQDSRRQRCHELGLRRLDPVSLEPLQPAYRPVQAGPAQRPDDRAPAPTTAQTLPRGGVCDLTGDDPHLLTVSWAASAAKPDVDIVGFVVDDSGHVAADEDMIFYNQPCHACGAVQLDLDTSSEVSVHLAPALLAEHRSVVVAGALDGSGTFADLGPVEIALWDSDGHLLMRSTQDAAEDETAMILARLYARGDTWRLRSVGQGYQLPLDGLARLYGVDVADH